MRRPSSSRARARGAEIEEAKRLLAELEELRRFKDAHADVCPCRLCYDERVKTGHPSIRPPAGEEELGQNIAAGVGSVIGSIFDELAPDPRDDAARQTSRERRARRERDRREYLKRRNGN